MVVWVFRYTYTVCSIPWPQLHTHVPSQYGLPICLHVCPTYWCLCMHAFYVKHYVFNYMYCIRSYITCRYTDYMFHLYIFVALTTQTHLRLHAVFQLHVLHVVLLSLCQFQMPCLCLLLHYWVVLKKPFTFTDFPSWQS